MDGWPCQRVSLYKDPKSGSESVEVFLWVIIPLGQRRCEFGHFWGPCDFVAWMTKHRIGSKVRTLPTAYQSLIFERREREMSNLDGWSSGNLPCIASQSPLHDLLRIWHIRKTQDDVILWSGLYITYRAILNIGLYNWLLQTGLLKLRFCITAYLYRDIHYHAVAPDVKLYTYTSISPIHLYPRYIHKCYNPIQIYLV